MALARLKFSIFAAFVGRGIAERELLQLLWLGFIASDFPETDCG